MHLLCSGRPLRAVCAAPLTVCRCPLLEAAVSDLQMGSSRVPRSRRGLTRSLTTRSGACLTTLTMKTPAPGSKVIATPLLPVVYNMHCRASSRVTVVGSDGARGPSWHRKPLIACVRQKVSRRTTSSYPGTASLLTRALRWRRRCASWSQVASSLHSRCASVQINRPAVRAKPCHV